MAINEGVPLDRKSSKGIRDPKLASNPHNKKEEKGILFEVYRSTQSVEGGNLNVPFFYIQDIANILVTLGFDCWYLFQ